MKKSLLGLAVIGALIAGPAMAADLGMPLKAPPAPVAPAFNWTGFYIGGNAGGAWSNTQWCTDATFGNCLSAAPFDLVNQSASGFVGGGQVGFRWQSSTNFVIGVEGMIDYLNISETSASCLSNPVPCGGFPPGSLPGRTRSTTFNDLDSVTGQIGYAWNQWLLYGKGGWAWSQLKLDANNTNPGGFDLSASENINGATGGVGIEYAITQNLSVGVEYDYYGFSNPGNIVNVANSGGVVVPCAFCNFSDTHIQTVTARLNWRFNWLNSPIATRY
jgi:outer membrane immunogenic protein